MTRYDCGMNPFMLCCVFFKYAMRRARRYLIYSIDDDARTTALHNQYSFDDKCV